MLKDFLYNSLLMFYNKYFSLMMTFERSKHVVLNDILSCVDSLPSE